MARPPSCLFFQLPWCQLDPWSPAAREDGALPTQISRGVGFSWRYWKGLHLGWAWPCRGEALGFQSLSFPVIKVDIIMPMSQVLL